MKYRAEQLAVAVALSVWGLAVAVRRLAHVLGPVCPCDTSHP